MLNEFPVPSRPYCNPGRYLGLLLPAKLAAPNQGCSPPQAHTAFADARLLDLNMWGSEWKVNSAPQAVKILAI